MNRRRWLIATPLLILFVAACGAVVEIFDLLADGASNLPLLAWIVVWIAALVLFIAQVGRTNGNVGREAGIEAIADTLPVGLALYDSAGKLRHRNKAFRQAFADRAIHADNDGDRELADGRWMRVQRQWLADGGSAVTALDISRIVALEEDLRVDRRQLSQLLCAAADWIWETDVLHRFSSISRVDTEGESDAFDWMIGRSLAELAGGGEGPNGWTAEDCLRKMSLGERLREIHLILYDGGRTAPARLGGVPRYDGEGVFLGYRGLGLWQETAPPRAEAVGRRAPPAPARLDGRLLVVDDSSLNRQLAQSILGKMGYETDTAEGGPQAVEAVGAGGYAAVLMDIWMPGMDGFEAMAAIRELPPPHGNLPIIAMTAHTGAEERRRCLDAGMDDHVEKPIDREALAAVLRRFVGTPPGAGTVDPRDDGPTAELDAANLVNDDVLEQLRHDAGPALVNELIAAYMGETDDRLIRIEAAVAAGTLDDIGADAHSMKSSSGTFGAFALQLLSATLEEAAMRGDAAAVAAASTALPELISETWREFALRGYRRDPP